ARLPGGVEALVLDMGGQPDARPHLLVTARLDTGVFPPILAGILDQSRPADDDTSLDVDPEPVLPPLALDRLRLALDDRHRARIPLFHTDGAGTLPAQEFRDRLAEVVGGEFQRVDAAPGGPPVDLHRGEWPVDAAAQGRGGLPVVGRTPTAAVGRDPVR